MVQNAKAMVISAATAVLVFARAMYCWIFLLFSFCAAVVLWSGIAKVMAKPAADSGDIMAFGLIGAFSAIFGIAWWMIFRHRPNSQQWAMAANCVLIAPNLLGLLFGGWRDFWSRPYFLGPFTPFGLLGIVIFSLPYGIPKSRGDSAQTDPQSSH